MRFWEAMKALEEGKRVRCKIWENNWHAYKCPYDGFVYGLQAKVDTKSEWELHEEPQKLLTFSEVINGLKQNKMFKRKFIKVTYTIFLNRDKNDTIYVLPLLEPWRCTIEDFEATDWVQVDG